MYVIDCKITYSVHANSSCRQICTRLYSMSYFTLTLPLENKIFVCVCVCLFPSIYHSRLEPLIWYRLSWVSAFHAEIAMRVTMLCKLEITWNNCTRIKFIISKWHFQTSHEFILTNCLLSHHIIYLKSIPSPLIFVDNRAWDCMNKSGRDMSIFHFPPAEMIYCEAFFSLAL